MNKIPKIKEPEPVPEPVMPEEPILCGAKYGPMKPTPEILKAVETHEATLKKQLGLDYKNREVVEYYSQSTSPMNHWIIIKTDSGKKVELWVQEDVRTREISFENATQL